MYKFSPINKITGITHGGNYDQKIPAKRNMWLKNGFLILALGILISILSLLLKDFFVSTKA